MGANSKSVWVGLLSRNTSGAKEASLLINDHDRVRTLVSVEAEGHLVKSGTVGTVVDISQTSDAYEIEFKELLCCVVTMTRDQFVRI